MDAKVNKQAQNTYKNKETKYLGCCKMFIGCSDGSVQEFSMVSLTVEYDFGKILGKCISSMAKTFGNKS